MCSSDLFSDQALTAEYLVKEAKNLKPGVHNVPTEIDKEVARLKLASMGGSVDVLTPAIEPSVNLTKVGLRSCSADKVTELRVSRA